MKITRPFKPVKENADFATLRDYPYYCTPKIDGILCMKIDGKAVSASLKPIRNIWIRRWIESNCPDGFIGELTPRKKPYTFQDVTSMVMSEFNKADFVWNVFDWVRYETEEYGHRILELVRCGMQFAPNKINFIIPETINNAKEAKQFLAKCLKEGYEGIILRSPDSVWKNGYATPAEDTFWRYKPFIDGEAEIIDFYEQQENCNIATKNERGLTTRSSRQYCKFGKNTLGGFVVRDCNSSECFKIGTGKGLTNNLRDTIWHNCKAYIGKIIKYKKQLAGEKNKPRTPIFLGFRDKDDL